MITPYKRRNLIALAEVLENLPQHKRDEHFNMDYWVDFNVDDVNLELSVRKVLHGLDRSLTNAIVKGAEANPCGTSACAAGWAVIHGIGVHKRPRGEDMEHYIRRYSPMTVEKYAGCSIVNGRISITTASARRLGFAI